MQYADVIHRCFRCGYCKFTKDFSDFNCPTYRKYWFDTYSPGGRMWLVRAWLNGDVEPSRRLSEILYSCVACGNCREHCVFDFRVDLVNIFVAARKEMVEQGHTLPAVRDYFKGISTRGNPFNQPREDRGKWADGLGLEPYNGQEYLLHVGCVGSYDERGKKIAAAVASLLKKAGVPFGILGANESCDGNEVRMLGEFGLFQALAEGNIENFKKLGVRKVIALSPHAYNTFKNDYPALGADFEVMHYTQALEQLVRENKVSFPQIKARVTYHDPCFLGRHNDVFDAPRKVLRSMPGLILEEMQKNSKNALCCGGGGNFHTDIIGSGEAGPARVRIREAVETGASILAVACPNCAKMFEDARRDEGLEDRIQVKDIAEIALM
ncbi:MAG: (Fe-S)-binding protein [Candidatus Abyssobacteria bacterium SURF_5]|uniref:(Fe-S)-binding protein n=1 Tax=Abyssobacteria bacterium (strain SURF_5) TaxID=2093360 RepID=A0A3A4NCX2_ABYX5|nr:MAG: (Fe-S)-binding protein [Candidatus Abyssubacteria bacterium SURF_5]